MKYFIALAALLLLGYTSTVVESDGASYDGKKMLLKGSVSLIHQLGSIKAENASITRDDASQDFSFLEVSDHVTFHPSFGGKLTCDNLRLDAEEEKADLFSERAKNWVTYDGYLGSEPLFFKSPHVHLAFATTKNRKVFDGVREIEAFVPVLATYAKHFHLSAERAKFSEETQLLTFLPEAPHEHCLLNYEGSGLVKAKKIDVDPKNHSIQLSKSQGKLSFVPNQDVSFQGDLLTFEESGNELTLSKNVLIYSQGYKWTSDQDVLFTLNPTDDSPIKHIESLGKTVISNELMTLSCNGTATADADNQEVCLLGNKEQVFYKDKLGLLKADKITIYYDLENNRIVPKKFTFEGNVAALNSAALLPTDKEEILRYALADVVVYIPQKQELTLKATPKKRVLFFDGIKKTRLSAEEIIVDLPQGEKKERIRTVGNVRMIFSEKESQDLEAHFG